MLSGSVASGCYVVFISDGQEAGGVAGGIASGGLLNVVMVSLST